MRRDVREGFLLLADISGYTRFITETDLEAGHEVVQDLLRTLLVSLGGDGSCLSIVKLEGDAILCRSVGNVDGAKILDRIEDSYHAFRMHLFTLDQAGRCACFACGSAQALDLKFAVHHGSYVIHDLAGHEDISGAAVIAVHRLLKNGVKSNAYALFSQSARQRCPEGTRFRDHVEHYEHIGEMRCGVLSLELSYVDMINSSRHAIAADSADAQVEWTVDAPPLIAWAFHFDPLLRQKWDDAAWSIAGNAQGRVRVGAMAACSELECSLELRIVEWRPPVSVTFEVAPSNDSPELRTTYGFEEIAPDRTRVTQRLKLRSRDEAGLRYLAQFVDAAPRARASAAARLTALLAEEASTATNLPPAARP